MSVSDYSKIGYWTNTTFTAATGNTSPYVLTTGITGTELDAMDANAGAEVYFNFDVDSLSNTTNHITNVELQAVNTGVADGASLASVTLTSADNGKGLVEISSPSGHTGDLKVLITTTSDNGDVAGEDITLKPVIADIFSFGNTTNNAIYRILLEETDDNSATFVGSVEYTMINQENVDDSAMYAALETIDQDVDIIVHEDLTDEDSVRVNYMDLGADGISTQIADQQEAPTHSGVVSFDLDNYKIGDTVVVTLDDQDMNEDSELIDVYTTTSLDVVGEGSDVHTGLVLDITFDDVNWSSYANGGCSSGTVVGSDGLQATGFTLVETDAESGIFTGSFQIPTNFCHASNGVVTVTGTDIEVNYQDYRNASGELTEVGDGASVNANTGSVAFDRTVYPYHIQVQHSKSTQLLMEQTIWILVT